MVVGVVRVFAGGVDAVGAKVVGVEAVEEKIPGREADGGEFIGRDEFNDLLVPGGITQSCVSSCRILSN